MPGWSTKDAKRHNRAARKNPVKARAFAHAAESAASQGLSEARQIMVGNAAAKRAGRRSRRSRRA